MVIVLTLTNKIVCKSALIGNHFSRRKQLMVWFSCVSWSMETILPKLSITEKGPKQKKTFIGEQHQGYDLIRVPDCCGLIPPGNSAPHRHLLWWYGGENLKDKSEKSMGVNRDSSIGKTKATHKQSKKTWRVAVGFLYPVLSLWS